MSGAKVVIAMFGAVLAIALIAVTGFLLTGDDSVQCVEGELQDNQIDSQGQFIPRTESFATIDEAEAFVCKRLPRPRDTDGLDLADISVTRTSNLANLIEATGGFSTRFVYRNESGELSFEAFTPAFLAPDEEAEGEPIQVAGHEGRLIETESGTVVTWPQAEYVYRAEAVLTEDFNLERLITILGSVR